MSALKWWIPVVCGFVVGVLAACEADEQGDPALACLESELVAQCPQGSNPVLGSMADALCDASADGDVRSANGSVSGRCFSRSSCRVLCQFSDPCPCGIARITEEGVLCAECEGISACGDGRCADGEDLMSCPQDCSPTCEPGEMLCDNTNVLSCNLNGYFDVLACPDGQACTEDENTRQLDCRADIVVEPGLEPAPNPSVEPDPEEEWIAGGRLRVGPGVYPGTADMPAPTATPVALAFRTAFSLSPRFVEVMVPQVVFGANDDTFVFCIDADDKCYRGSGWRDPVSVEDYCAAQDLCLGDTEPAPCAMATEFFSPSYPWTANGGVYFLRCVYDYLVAQGENGCIGSQAIEFASGCGAWSEDDDVVDITPSLDGGPAGQFTWLSSSPSVR